MTAARAAQAPSSQQSRALRRLEPQWQWARVRARARCCEGLPGGPSAARGGLGACKRSRCRGREVGCRAARWSTGG
eukprot:15434020-Alexandrium_andersonii.AAC.1